MRRSVTDSRSLDLLGLATQNRNVEVVPFRFVNFVVRSKINVFIDLGAGVVLGDGIKAG